MGKHRVGAWELSGLLRTSSPTASTMDPGTTRGSKEDRRRRWAGVRASRLPSDTIDDTDRRRTLQKDPTPPGGLGRWERQLVHACACGGGGGGCTEVGNTDPPHQPEYSQHTIPCRMLLLDRRAVACLICSRSQAWRPSSSDDVSNMASYTPSPGASRPSTCHPVVDHLQGQVNVNVLSPTRLRSR
jgi:hypothetical protein